MITHYIHRRYNDRLVEWFYSIDPYIALDTLSGSYNHNFTHTVTISIQPTQTASVLAGGIVGSHAPHKTSNVHSAPTHTTMIQNTETTNNGEETTPLQPCYMHSYAIISPVG